MRRETKLTQTKEGRAILRAEEKARAIHAAPKHDAREMYEVFKRLLADRTNPTIWAEAEAVIEKVDHYIHIIEIE